VQQKLDSQFIYALRKGGTQDGPDAVPDLQPDLKIHEGGTVLVDITGRVTRQLLAAIVRLGGDVVSSSAEFNAVSALVPLSNLAALAELEEVSFIERAAEFTTNTGSVDSQGDVTHRAAAARTAFGFNGAGVRV